jgi:PKD repeat protein
MITSHAYSSPETYTAALTVKDEAGNTATQEIKVTVLSAERFPMWIVGAIIAIIGIAVGTVFLIRRRK